MPCRIIILFVPGLSELCMCGRSFDPGVGLYAPQLHEPQPISWGFHTVRGNIESEDHDYRARNAVVVDT